MPIPWQGGDGGDWASPELITFLCTGTNAQLQAFKVAIGAGYFRLDRSKQTVLVGTSAATFVAQDVLDAAASSGCTIQRMNRPGAATNYTHMAGDPARDWPY
jgi:hypothetical protein